MKLQPLLYSELAPDTGDMNKAIFIGAILIALFVIFLVIKNRRR